MTKNIVPALIAIALVGQSFAASPPDLVNYQGVLRDTSDAPLDGDYDMVFRFYDTGAGGNAILVDSHLEVNGEAVTVDGGLFNAQLGDGQVVDGPGPGTYTSLAQVFRDHAFVYLEIEIDTETLSPRVRMVSAGYALNADHLDGMTSGDFLDTSAGSQVKAGDLTVNRLTLTGEYLDLAHGGNIDSHDGLIKIHGNSNLDDIYIQGGNDTADGSIRIFGQGGVYFRSYNGNFEFSSTDSGLDTALLDTNGNFDIAGALQVGSTTATAVAWSRFGTSTPYASSDITQSNDVHISGDLEVDDVLYVDRSIVVSDDDPIINQNFSSFGNANFKMRSEVDSGNDVYIEGDLEVGANIFTNALHNQGEYWIDVWAESTIYNMIDNDDSSTTDEFRWYHNGSLVGNQIAELQEDGDLRISGLLSESVAFDIAESFLAVEPLEPGDLVSVDSSRPDAVRRAMGADDRAVIGVVSRRPGVLLGDAPFDPGTLKEAWGEDVHDGFITARERLREEVLTLHPDLQNALESLPVGDDETEQRRVRLEDEIDGLALEMFFRERFVPVALAGRVPVKIDAGYGAIRIGDLLTASPTPGHAMYAYDPEPGTVIGKALEPFDVGTGTITVLVMLR
jgi:hypothetical protein